MAFFNNNAILLILFSVTLKTYSQSIELEQNMNISKRLRKVERLYF